MEIPEADKLTREKIEQLVKAGKVADLKLYQDMLNRIARGEKLTATEHKSYERLGNKLGLIIDPEDQPDVISTYEGAAKYCGISKRTLHNWIRAGFIVQEPNGTFLKKKLDVAMSRMSKDDDDRKERLFKAELRYREWKAEKEELTVRVMKGQLIEREEVIRIFTERAYGITRMLLNMSRRTASVLSVKNKKKLKDTTAILDREIRRVMIAYSRPIELGKDVTDD